MILNICNKTLQSSPSMKNGSSALTAGSKEYVRRLLMPSSASLATTVTTYKGTDMTLMYVPMLDTWESCKWCSTLAVSQLPHCMCCTLSNSHRLPLSCTLIHTVSTSLKFSGMVVSKGPWKTGALSLMSATMMVMGADTSVPPPSLAWRRKEQGEWKAWLVEKAICRNNVEGSVVDTSILNIKHRNWQWIYINHMLL